MRASILNGSEKDDPAAEALHEILLHELETLDYKVEPFILRELDIRRCVGCFGCWVQTPGLCLVDDASRTIARAISQSDLVIYLTPVTFGGYSSQLKKVLDRSIGIVSPFFTQIGGETHHRPRYERYPRLLGLGLLPMPDAESERIFTTLVGRNAINMHAPAYSAGVTLRDQSISEMRDRVQNLLRAVEVAP